MDETWIWNYDGNILRGKAEYMDKKFVQVPPFLPQTYTHWSGNKTGPPRWEYEQKVQEAALL
jgi:hypothetical protein